MFDGKKRRCEMETRIAKDQPVVTLINVFTVQPADQQRLVEVLVEATEETMRHLPGFVSANIHRSLDGTRVTNYAQWRSAADFRAMLGNPLLSPTCRNAGSWRPTTPTCTRSSTSTRPPNEALLHLQNSDSSFERQPALG
jgi:quinol monooxygenase YgiN